MFWLAICKSKKFVLNRAVVIMSRFSRGLRREWKIPVLGCLAFTIAKFISHSDVPSLKWIGIIGSYFVLFSVALHFVALFFYPDSNEEYSQQDKEKLEAFIGKNLHKGWLTISFASGVVSLSLMAIGIVRLFEQQGEVIFSVPYLCASVFFFGIFYSIKDYRFAKRAMSVGGIGAAITAIMMIFVN